MATFPEEDKRLNISTCTVWNKDATRITIKRLIRSQNMSAIYTRTGTVKAMKLTPEAMHFRDVTWPKVFFYLFNFFSIWLSTEHS